METAHEGLALRARLLTLRYEPECSCIDDRPLRQLVVGKRVLAIREHFFVFHDLPHVACLVTYVESDGKTTTSDETEPTAPRATRARPTRDLIAELAPEDRASAQRLRQWRAATAREEGVPPYVILTNRELVAIIHAKPGSKTALRQIEGIGPAKANRHGEAILSLLESEAAQ